MSQFHNDLKNAGGTGLSVIVVSDVHLGDETSNYRNFSEFIDWIAALEKDGERSINGGEMVLEPPEKLILLGDIIELWSPKDNDLKHTMQESFEPFMKMAGLRCDKVFVLGNHDEDIAESLDLEMILKGGREIRENTFTINGSEFRIINRHYPEDPEDGAKGYLQVGDRKYFLIHGQQFDKLFIGLGPLAGIPTLTAKISNMFSKLFPPDGWSIVAVFAVLSLLYVVFRNEVLLTLSAVSFLLSVPRLFTYLQDRFWAVFGGVLTDRPKYKDIRTIIEKNYYDIDKDKTDWDVNIIFGHTHVPQIHLHKHTEDGINHEWLFLNSGSWTQEKGRYNTFIYLDRTGSYLFKWNTGGTIERIPAEG